MFNRAGIVALTVLLLLIGVSPTASAQGGPTVTINQAGTADPTNGAITFTVVFSESVSDFTTGDVTLTGTAGATTGTVTGSGTTYTVTASGMTSDGTVIATVPAGVATGTGGTNSASTSTDNSVTYDTTAPTVTINQAGTADPTNGAITFNVVFSETVTTFATGDVTLTGTAGATTGTVTGSGTTYTVTASGMTSDGTVIASIAAGVAPDPAGNDNAASTSTDNSVTRDTTAPTVTVEQKAGQADPTTSGPILFTVTFSETVTGFTSSDVTLSGTSTGGTATVSGSGSSYEISVSGMSIGTVIASIPAASATDAAGNDNAASTSTDNSVRFNEPAGSGGGAGTPQPTGSHGYSVGTSTGGSYNAKTSHFVSFQRGGVATLTVELASPSTVSVTVTTKDEPANDLPAGYTSTNVLLDIEMQAEGGLQSATFRMRPLAGSALDGRTTDIVVLHKTASGWVEVPSSLVTLDDGRIQITFTATDLSPFVVAHKGTITATPSPTQTSTQTMTQTQGQPPAFTSTATGTTTPADPNPTPSLGFLVSLAAVAAVAALIKRRR